MNIKPIDIVIGFSNHSRSSSDKGVSPRTRVNFPPLSAFTTPATFSSVHIALKLSFSSSYNSDHGLYSTEGFSSRVRETGKRIPTRGNKKSGTKGT